MSLPAEKLSPADWRSAEAPPEYTGVKPGSAAHRKISLALFLGGFSTFSLLYSVQPLMPALAAHFGITAAQSSLALSVSTASLAIAILCAGALSETLGRRALMCGSLVFAALLNLIAACMPLWHGLLAARLLEGILLGGVPAVAMAYLAEEMEPKGLAGAMGLYVAGTAIGGMLGRVGMSLLMDHFNWRVSLGALSAIDLAAALAFIVLLPPSRRFVRRPNFDLADNLSAWRGHLSHPGLPFLFAISFLLMGSFVTAFNYITFHLMNAPFSLSPGQIGLIFLAYLFGALASSMAGKLTERHGRWPVLSGGLLAAVAGVLLTLVPTLPVLVVGVIVLTMGFFVAHAVASGWVGRLGAPRTGHATSLYLLFYYLGSSVMGSSGGWFWEHGGWPAVAGFCIAALMLALASGLRLRRFAAV